MKTFLFFCLARHQTDYFQRLLAHTALQGYVVTARQMPFPALRHIGQVIRRVNWAQLVAEKCFERRIKHKYHGWWYRSLLRLEMLVAGLRIQAMLEYYQPSAVVLWNGSNRLCQILLALLPEGIETYFFENGLLPNTTTVDAHGVNFRNSVPREAAFYRQYALTQVQNEAVQAIQLVPRKAKVHSAAVELPERFIFMPFQVDLDSQVRLFSPWVRNMRELFAVAQALTQATGLPVVCKEHPSSRSVYPDLHTQVSPQLFFANGNATQALIEACTLVVTLNSTVGLEALLLGKPVLTLGQAFFNIAGLVMHADSLDEAIAHVQRYPNWPLDESLRHAFLQYLAHHYCVPGAWKQADAAHFLAVAQRLQPELKE